MREELKEELLENQQAKMEEFEKELKLLKAKVKLVENFNEQVLSQRNEHEQLRQDLHQFHLDFFGIVNEKMKEFNKRALYQHSKFKLLSINFENLFGWHFLCLPSGTANETSNKLLIKRSN
jgi:hypothetical protein